MGSNILFKHHSFLDCHWNFSRPLPGMTASHWCAFGNWCVLHFTSFVSESVSICLYSSTIPHNLESGLLEKVTTILCVIDLYKPSSFHVDWLTVGGQIKPYWILLDIIYRKRQRHENVDDFQTEWKKLRNFCSDGYYIHSVIGSKAIYLKEKINYVDFLKKSVKAWI